MQSVQEAIAAAASLLTQAGVESPRVDAELLAAQVLGVSRGRLAVARFDAAGQARFADLVRARAARQPVQHLTGSAPFRFLELAVGPACPSRAPRPSCWSNGAWAGSTVPTPRSVVDLCSGSGAIALSVAHEHPGSRVYAVECSPQALNWLRRNACAAPVTVVEAT